MRSICGSLLLVRRSTAGVKCPPKIYQRRWAQVHDVRFLVTHPNSHRVLDKYREKLEEKARQEGKSNVEELKEAYKDEIVRLRNNAVVPGANAPLSEQQPPSPLQAASSIPFQPPPAPEPEAQDATKTRSKSPDGVKTLGSFIDVEKAAALSQREIEAIWRLRHIKDSRSLCAVMHSATFKRIAETAGKHPQFILPIPREENGAEIHFMQWTFPSPSTVTVLFTHLAEFKLRGEYAQPHTTVTHHLDLAESNELVLLEGRVMENRGISVEEGKWLLMCLQKFYGFEATSDLARESQKRRKRLMEQFSGGDEGFRVEELLEEVEKVP